MKEYINKNLKIINADCMEIMKNYCDNYFDLAIVDPPYGVKYARDIAFGINNKSPKLNDVKWDSKPQKKYFTELFRVSKHQIIWGGNHLTDIIPVSKCWIVWNKTKNNKNKSVFSDCELAWTSFKKVVKMFSFTQMGFIKDTKDINRIHPTQKPTELYKWILENYAQNDFKILDSHLGSGSSAIASFYFGCKEFIGIERDEIYFNKTIKRVEEQTKQIKLF